MTSHLPAVTSTPEDRLAALKEAKALLFVPGTESKSIFGTASSKATAPATPDLFRVAEYITTGHDYLDTHPKGKRRPVINNTTTIVVAPGNADADDVEHFLQHVANGDFAEFMEEQVAKGESEGKFTVEKDDEMTPPSFD